jgi:protoheme IX farnesyltransferase
LPRFTLVKKMSKFGDYVTISKPRIMILLLVVAWAAMFVAEQGFPDLRAFLAVTAAGIFSTASSGAFNNVYERDKDAKMGRTADRPLPAGRLSVLEATLYGLIMGIASFAVLYFPGYHLAAYLTLGAVAFYFVIYTVILKPTTPQNIVIGGFAGSFPALIGWSASTGTLSWAAWLLALIVFFWTPPHFWALNVLYAKDYEAAAFPMMINAKGEESTKRQMFFYAGLTVITSFALVPVGPAGYLYMIAASYFGYRFVKECADLFGDVPKPQVRKYFLYTIQYLGFLLMVLILDVVLVAKWPVLGPF